MDSNQRLGILTIDESTAEQKECFGKKDFCTKYSNNIRGSHLIRVSFPKQEFDKEREKIQGFLSTTVCVHA